MIMASIIYKFLFEDEAIVGINSPLDYFYMKIMRRSLIPICLWPEKELGENPSKVIVVSRKIILGFVHVMSMFQQMAYMIKHKDTLTFFEIGHLYLCMFITTNITVRFFGLVFSPGYRKLITSFLKEFHIFYFRNKSEYAITMHKQIHLISHLFTVYILAQMLSGAALFNLTPMFNNYTLGKYSNKVQEESPFEYAVYLLFPFNNETDMRGYIFTCMMGWVLSYITSFWFCIVDLILSVMVFHIWGHFKILIHTLENFPKPKLTEMVDSYNVPSNNGIYSESESIMIADMLKECVKYHQTIITFTDRMSDVFGLTICAYLCFHQISGCVLLLECSQMTVKALMRYLPLTVIMFQQLIQISVVFELVGSVSDRLSDAVYSLPWQYMDTKNRKTAYILLMHVQTPIHIKALGLADVGVNTMAKIIKTSLSYFAFLRTMK